MGINLLRVTEEEAQQIMEEVTTGNAGHT